MYELESVARVKSHDSNNGYTDPVVENFSFLSSSVREQANISSLDKHIYSTNFSTDSQESLSITRSDVTPNITINMDKSHVLECDSDGKQDLKLENANDGTPEIFTYNNTGSSPNHSQFHEKQDLQSNVGKKTDSLDSLLENVNASESNLSHSSGNEHGEVKIFSRNTNDSSFNTPNPPSQKLKLMLDGTVIQLDGEETSDTPILPVDLLKMENEFNSPIILPPMKKTDPPPQSPSTFKTKPSGNSKYEVEISSGTFDEIPTCEYYSDDSESNNTRGPDDVHQKKGFKLQDYINRPRNAKRRSFEQGKLLAAVLQPNVGHSDNADNQDI